MKELNFCYAPEQKSLILELSTVLNFVMRTAINL